MRARDPSAQARPDASAASCGPCGARHPPARDAAPRRNSALLRAEIAVKSEKIADAKSLLLSLSSDLGAPEWIRFFANNLLSTIE